MNSSKSFVEMISKADPVLSYLSLELLARSPGLYRTLVLRDGEYMQLALEPNELLSLSRGEVVVLSDGNEVATLADDNCQRVYVNDKIDNVISVSATTDSILSCVDMHVLDHIMSIDGLVKNSILPSGDNSLIELLKNNEYLRSFPLELVMSIVTDKNELCVISGTEFISLGDKVNELYIVVSGILKMDRFDFENENFSISKKIYPGEAFGFDEIFLDNRAEYRIISLENSRLLRVNKDVVINRQEYARKFDVSPQVAQSMIMEGYTIIDVRYPEEFEDQKIENSVLIPLDSLKDNIDFFSKNKKYLIYCRSGKRSLSACYTLDQFGFNVVNLSGGILGWPYYTI